MSGCRDPSSRQNGLISQLPSPRESVSFPHTKGLQNQNYEIKAYSDNPVSLFIPGNSLQAYRADCAFHFSVTGDKLVNQFVRSIPIPRNTSGGSGR